MSISKNKSNQIKSHQIKNTVQLQSYQTLSDFNKMSTKSISVLNIIPFDRQYLSNLFLNELTDGNSTTYPDTLFHKLVTCAVKKFLLTLVLHCHVLKVYVPW